MTCAQVKGNPHPLVPGKAKSVNFPSLAEIGMKVPNFKDSNVQSHSKQRGSSTENKRDVLDNAVF